jgi:hypothetical protein
MLPGWQSYKDYPHPRVRERFARHAKKMIGAYNAALRAMERNFRNVNRSPSEKIHSCGAKLKGSSRLSPAL